MLDGPSESGTENAVLWSFHSVRCLNDFYNESRAIPFDGISASKIKGNGRTCHRLDGIDRGAAAAGDVSACPTRKLKPSRRLRSCPCSALIRFRAPRPSLLPNILKEKRKNDSLPHLHVSEAAPLSAIGSQEQVNRRRNKRLIRTTFYL